VIVFDVTKENAFDRIEYFRNEVLQYADPEYVSKPHLSFCYTHKFFFHFYPITIIDSIKTSQMYTTIYLYRVKKKKSKN
jgi:hypothetical protein